MNFPARKPRAKKVQPDVEDEEMAEAPTPKKTPRKRRSPGKFIL